MESLQLKVLLRSLSLHLSGIKQWHVTQGFTDLTQASVVRKTMKGIR
jgi:hypothetical protein